MEEDSNCNNNEEDEDENNSVSDNESKKFAKVSDIYSFNYSPKLKKIIFKYIPKNLCDNNSHYIKSIYRKKNIKQIQKIIQR